MTGANMQEIALGRRFPEYPDGATEQIVHRKDPGARGGGGAASACATAAGQRSRRENPGEKGWTVCEGLNSIVTGGWPGRGRCREPTRTAPPARTAPLVV